MTLLLDRDCNIFFTQHNAGSTRMWWLELLSLSKKVLGFNLVGGTFACPL